MLFSVSETQIQWQFRKMEDLVEPTASVLSHHYLISLQLVLLCHFSFFMFVFFYPELSLLTDPELSFFFFFCGASEKEQDQRSEASSAIGDSRNEVGLSPGQIMRHVDLEIGSFAGLETRGPRDRIEPRPNLLLLSFSFLFFSFVSFLLQGGFLLLVSSLFSFFFSFFLCSSLWFLLLAASFFFFFSSSSDGRDG